MRQALTAATNCGWTLVFALAASALLSTELGAQAQESTGSSCDSQTWELTADGPFAPGNITAALAEAAACNGTSVVSVEWTGSIASDERFLVQAGVELRIVGDGYSFDNTEIDLLLSPYDDSSWASPATMNTTATAAMDAAVSGNALAGSASSSSSSVSSEQSVLSSSNGSTSLFVVEVGGALHLSNMTLTGAWGGDQGGGAVYTSGGTVTSHNCRWTSLSSNSEGGALHAEKSAIVDFTGINVFEDCEVKSGGDGGGALYLGDSTTTSVGGVIIFENCTSATDGGAMLVSTGASLTFSPESDTRFWGSRADDKGGGMYIKDATVEVAENASVYFHECSSATASGGKGGGICSYRSNFSVGADATLTFSNNSSPNTGDGGGMFGQSTVVTVASGAALIFEANSVGSSGGGLFLEWDADELDDDTDATGLWTSCFTLAPGATANFYKNSAGDFGGGAAFTIGCQGTISGNASFLQNSAVRAGAMVVDGGSMDIPGDVSFVGNSAERWGGAVLLVDSTTLGLSFTGTANFSGNSAGRSGGALYVENGLLEFDSVAAEAAEGGGGEEATAEEGEGGEFVSTVAAVSWVGNSAGYDGGVICVDGGTVRVVGGAASSNSASQRGGVIFATGESEVAWTAGQSSHNTAASGGALYISSSQANFSDIVLDEDNAPSGGVVFLAGADVRAMNVTIIAPYPSSGFAVHLDSESVFRAYGCGFRDWEKDSPCVISEGAVVLDSCDFSDSTSDVLISASREVTVRNAIMGDKNYAYVGYNSSANFAVDAHTCASLPEASACLIEGECVDAANGMGVLCPSYVAEATGETVSLVGAGGGSSTTSVVSVFVRSSNSESEHKSESISEFGSDEQSEESGSVDIDAAVYYPDLVVQEIVLSLPLSGQSDSGSGSSSTAYNVTEEEEGVFTDGVLWELRYPDGSEYGTGADEDGLFSGLSRDNFSWTAVPSVGYLQRGEEVTVTLVGTPPPPSIASLPSLVYNGDVAMAFQVLSRTAEEESWAMSEVVAMESIYYNCAAGSYWGNDSSCVSCAEQMAAMADGDGVLECTTPGITLDTLPLTEGEMGGGGGGEMGKGEAGEKRAEEEWRYDLYSNEHVDGRVRQEGGREIGEEEEEGEACLRASI